VPLAGGVTGSNATNAPASGTATNATAAGAPVSTASSATAGVMPADATPAETLGSWKDELAGFLSVVPSLADTSECLNPVTCVFSWINDARGISLSGEYQKLTGALHIDTSSDRYVAGELGGFAATLLIGPEADAGQAIDRALAPIAEDITDLAKGLFKDLLDAGDDTPKARVPSKAPVGDTNTPVGPRPQPPIEPTPPPARAGTNPPAHEAAPSPAHDTTAPTAGGGPTTPAHTGPPLTEPPPPPLTEPPPPALTEVPPVTDDPPPVGCGGMSFTPETQVLLPSQATTAISNLKPGDKVIATNTTTGKPEPQTVQAVLVHYDTDLYNLTVKTAHGSEVIHTTSNHLFWDPHLYKWIPANHLKKGEKVDTPSGALATADGGTTPADHDSWMWDLTVQNDHDFYVLPSRDDGHNYSDANGSAQIAATRRFHDTATADDLTINRLHTYYVVAGSTPVLVHNINAPCGPADGGMHGRLQPAGAGKQINHMPADASTGSLITKYSGPSIRMDTADHAQLYTTGSSYASQAWRSWQQELVSQGRIDEAMQMDINDVRARFGTKYDSAITEMINSLPDNPSYQALRTLPRTGDVIPGLPWSNADASP
jgi:pretoxin HINT domain-containing protein